jgi:hypothetical protein
VPSQIGLEEATKKRGKTRENEGKRGKRGNRGKRGQDENENEVEGRMDVVSPSSSIILYPLFSSSTPISYRSYSN